MRGAGRLLLSEQLFDLSRQSLARVHIAEVSLPINQPHGRDALDAGLLTYAILPAAAVEVLRPFHLLLLQHVVERLLLLVKADADDLESFVVQFVIFLR